MVLRGSLFCGLIVKELILTNSFILELRDINFSYGSTQIIKDLNLSLKLGEICGWKGPSGCGKSTLLHLIAGFERPDSGEVRVFNEVLSGSNYYVLPEKRGIGFLFQDLALFPHLSVAENIEFGLHSMSKKSRRVKMFQMLELVHLEGFASRYPHELSGGQQQRIALARALAPGPKLLLIDEPFSNLDTVLSMSILEDVRSILKNTGVSAILVSHSNQELEAMCDRIVDIESVSL